MSALSKDEGLPEIPCAPILPDLSRMIPAGLPVCDWLLAFTTTVPLDYKADTETGQTNRQALKEMLAPLSLTWLALEHGNQIACDPKASPVTADGAIITEEGHAVAFTTADCLPVVVVDIIHHILVGIHAGWRGLASGIIENALTQIDSGGEGLYAWIGPGIAQGDYEVGPETCNALREIPALAARQEEHDRLLMPRGFGTWQADLPAIAAAILVDAGIPATAITRYPISTFRGRHLHSARRDGLSSGRMATVVGLKAL